MLPGILNFFQIFGLLWAKGYHNLFKVFGYAVHEILL